MILTLKQLRVVNDTSQQKMADLLKVHLATYRKIEQNPDTATIEQARIIAEFFGVPVDQIFFAH